MSIDLNWDRLKSGPDGIALADTIREFIHDRFQTVTLPRFIKSVSVHAFEFGSIAPEIEIKDICDPLPDFYAENDEDQGGEEEEGEGEEEEEEEDVGWQRTTTTSERTFRERQRTDKAVPPDGL